MRIVLLFILPLITLSCSDFKNSERLERISSMQEELNVIIDNLHEHELEKGEELTQNTSKLIKQLKTFEGDTIDLEIAIQFKQYKNMYDHIQPLLDHYAILDSSTLVLKNDLQKLSDDISNRFGKRNEYDDFLTFEKTKLEKSKQAVAEYVAEREELQKTYRELHQTLQNYVDMKQTQVGYNN